MGAFTTRVPCGGPSRFASSTLIGACLLVLAAPTVHAAQPTSDPAATQTASGVSLTCGSGDNGLKFDGQVTSNDAAVGVPGEDLGALTDAGRVEVRYVCGGGRAPQSLTLPVPHAGDRLGASSAGAWINSDSYQDLVVGVPGLDVGLAADAGGIAIFLGSPTGLRYSRTVTQASAGVPGTVQAGAQFGAAVASQAFAHSVDPAAASIVRVGEPGRNVGSAAAAGGFVDLAYGPQGLDSTRTREATLDSAGVPGTAASGDRLGSALWLDRRVGAPGKAVAGHRGAGAVLNTFRRGDQLVAQLITQDTPGMAGSAETGDGFGSALAGAWIGVPGESVGARAGAGMVQRWGGSPASWFALTQDSPGLAGSAEAGDHFGAALGEASHLVDDTQYSPDRLFIGAPGEDLGSLADVGSVAVLNERDDPEEDARILGGLGSLAAPQLAAGARFGSSIARAEFFEVRVGAPGAGGGAGRAYTYLSPVGTVDPPRPTLEYEWSQATGAAEPGDAFGSSFATTTN